MGSTTLATGVKDACLNQLRRGGKESPFTARARARPHRRLCALNGLWRAARAPHGTVQSEERALLHVVESVANCGAQVSGR